MHQPSQLEGHVAPVLEQVAPLGAQRAGGVGARCEQRLDHHGDRRHRLVVTGVDQRHPERGALAGHQVTTETGTGQGRQQLRPTSGRGVLAQVGHPAHDGIGARVERVQPHPAAGPQRHRAHAPGIGQVAVLALGVDHPGAAPEDGLAPQEGLDERALAPADLAEDDHVRVGHDARGVELEGIEDEGTAQQVVADHHAALAQARFGNERVGRPQVARRHLVGRHPRLSLSHGR